MTEPAAVRPVPIPRHGVSIAAIDRFLALARAARAGGTSGLTTGAVSRLFVVPATAATQSSFAELHCHDPELVSDATVFVSHAWHMRFDVLVECLRDVAAAALPATTFFWLDVLVNSQHNGAPHSSAAAKVAGVAHLTHVLALHATFPPAGSAAGALAPVAVR